MSDSPHDHIDDDLTSYSVDEENQLQEEDTLVDDHVEDVLDTGYSPPDQPRVAHSWGTTAYEESLDETIDQRIRQEVPDPASAAGAPDNESGLDVDEDEPGQDDPDDLAGDEGFYGDDEVGDARAGRLVAPDEGLEEDSEDELVGRDVGVDGAGASAEEAAVHVIYREERFEESDGERGT